MKISVKKGDVIYLELRPIPRVVVGRNQENQEKVGHWGWANKDNKVIVGFVRSEEDFKEFLLVLASCFGLEYKLTRTSFGCISGVVLNDVFYS